MKNYIRLVCLAFLLAAGAGAGFAEVLLPPPNPFDTASGEDGLLPEADTWLDLKRFSDGSGEPHHNYHYQLGGRFTIFRSGATSVDGELRMIFQSMQPGWSENNWLIDSSAIIVGQTLRGRYELAEGWLGAYFHHNSKHDLDRGRRRTPIHDVLALEAGSELLPELAAEGWLLSGVATLEYALEPLFQLEAVEPYAGGLFLEGDLARRIGGAPLTPFANLRAALIRNTISDAAWWDFDYAIRLGLRFPGSAQFLAVYGEVQRLSDDWVTRSEIGPEREFGPWTLLSLGILFSYAGN
jgi:hypothetical protein